MSSARIKKQQIIAAEVWDKYAVNQLTGKCSHTASFFFYRLNKASKYEFYTSDKPVVQFGVSSGKFYRQAHKRMSNRKVVGYDISNQALEVAAKNGVEPRNADLNDLADGGKRSALLEWIKEDTATTIDIILIRLFKYLKAEAVYI